MTKALLFLLVVILAFITIPTIVRRKEVTKQDLISLAAMALLIVAAIVIEDL